MKFEINDFTDKSLVKVLINEFSKCQLAFDLFIKLRNIKYINELAIDTELDLNTYNAYSLFIQHLYECFLGWVTRDKKNTKDVPADEIDELMNKNIEKLLKIWRDSIDKKISPLCEIANDRSYYEDPCPKEFGKHFRDIRNNIVHVDYRRVDGGNRISLSDFYLNYHKYVFLLYDWARGFWSIQDYSNLELGDITDFNNKINRLH